MKQSIRQQLEKLLKDTKDAINENKKLMLYYSKKENYYHSMVSKQKIDVLKEYESRLEEILKP